MENEQGHGNNNNTSGGSDNDSKKLQEEKKRRQNTLTRQSGFVNDSDSKLLKEAPSLNLRTGDGNVVVVVSDQDVEGDGKEQIINIEEGDIEIDCEDNFGYSSVCLQEGRGSASSMHSEPDNADNYSVSVELSVASLGSDDDEELGDQEFVDHADGVKLRKGEAIIDSKPEVINSETLNITLSLLSHCWKCYMSRLHKFQKVSCLVLCTKFLYGITFLHK